MSPNTVTSTARAASRTALDLWFKAVEAPIGVAARITGREADQTGGQLLEVFEGVQAQIEEQVGQLLRDQVLVQRAGLRRTKLAEQARAEQLRTAADIERHEADRRFSKQRQAAERQREEVAERAEQRKQQAEKQKAAVKRQAEKQAAARRTATAKAEQRAEEVIDERAREQRKTALSRESAALQTESMAVQAEKQLDAIDAAIEASKEDRRSS